MAYKRKLIEGAIPLAAINEQPARESRSASGEKSVHQGHPLTLYFWWARRGLAAARALLRTLLGTPQLARLARSIAEPQTTLSARERR